MGSAESYALRLIKRRLRSVWEIDQALIRKGVEPAERQAVTGKLLAHGLLDDRRFARAYVSDRDRLAPRGRFALALELRRKGLDEALVSETLAWRDSQAQAEPDDHLSEEEQARALAARRAPRYAGLPAETQKRRLAAYLQRRGYAADLVRRILNV